MKKLFFNTIIFILTFLSTILIIDKMNTNCYKNIKENEKKSINKTNKTFTKTYITLPQNRKEDR